MDRSCDSQRQFQRAAKQVCWWIKAKAPQGGLPMQAAWEYCVPHDIRIHIHKAPQRSYSAKTQPVQGPKKKWADDQSALDSHRKSRQPVRAVAPLERKRSRSPANSDMVDETQIDATVDKEPQVAKPTCELEELLQNGWSRKECGGQGDCGYLVAAQGIHFNKHGEFLSAEAAQRNASNLRLVHSNTYKSLSMLTDTALPLPVTRLPVKKLNLGTNGSKWERS